MTDLVVDRATSTLALFHHEFERARPKSDAVVQGILNLITDGALLPGDRLPAERNLAAAMHISRDTVREALRMLVQLGRIETRRGRYGGTFVCDDLTPTGTEGAAGDAPAALRALPTHLIERSEEVSARQALDTIYVLQLGAVELLSKQPQPPQVWEFLEAEQLRLASTAVAAYRGADAAFQIALVTASGMPYVRLTARESWRRVMQDLQRTTTSTCTRSATNTLNSNLLEAMQNGDIAQARALETKHLDALSWLLCNEV